MPFADVLPYDSGGYIVLAHELFVIVCLVMPYKAMYVTLFLFCVIVLSFSFHCEGATGPVRTRLFHNKNVITGPQSVQWAVV